jgi:hypothetical protein
LYSLSWVDLSQEPVILSHPDMGSRYFTFQLAAMTSDNFDYVGSRTTGSKAAHFALIGPGWTGALPDGVRTIERSPTPWILVAGRTLVDGADDVPAVRALQQQYKLTPLSLWGTDRQVPEQRQVLKPISLTEDPLGPWRTLNAMLAENPPPPEHAVLLRQFATIGIGPGLDVDAQPEKVKESLWAGPGRRDATAEAAFPERLVGDRGQRLALPPANEGRFGDELLYRAADQSLAGIVANDPAEAVYLVNFSDDTGARFSGDHRYELQFTADNLPPVDAFWSLTMYAADYNLVANPANCYSIGDRTPGVAKDAHGGMTLYIQAASPGADKESNWLPCPAEGTLVRDPADVPAPRRGGPGNLALPSGPQRRLSVERSAAAPLVALVTCSWGLGSSAGRCRRARPGCLAHSVSVPVSVHQPAPDPTPSSWLDWGCTDSTRADWVDAEHQPTDLAVGARVRLEPRRLMPAPGVSRPAPGLATGSGPAGGRAPPGPGPGRTAPSPLAALWSSGPRTGPAGSRSGGP